MGAISQLAGKCQKCIHVDKCDHKRMELCAYIEEPCMASITMPTMADLAQPLVMPHDYRNIKVGENTTVTIDVEEIKRQIEKDFYKHLSIGLNCGA